MLKIRLSSRPDILMITKSLAFVNISCSNFAPLYHTYIASDSCLLWVVAFIALTLSTYLNFTLIWTLRHEIDHYLFDTKGYLLWRKEYHSQWDFCKCSSVLWNIKCLETNQFHKLY